MQWFLVPFMGNPHLCLLFSIGLIIMLIIIVVVVIIIIIKKRKTNVHHGSNTVI